MHKLIDCITFYDENFLVNSRFEILKDVIDFFVVCESKFDHKGFYKGVNFHLKNKNYSHKVKHIILEENFPAPYNGWKNEEYQREKLMLEVKNFHNEDYIFFSDSDEIPNPEILKKFSLKKKYGIFLQKCFVYKLNLFNKYETPWEGTRVCKKKNLKSFTYLRKKIKSKNLKQPFWKLNIDKDIEIFNNGGWHFNNLYTVEKISKKLKTSPHQEFSGEKYSSEENIHKKLNNFQDLYNRGHTYQKIDIDKSYPEYFLNNTSKIKDYIL